MLEIKTKRFPCFFLSKEATTKDQQLKTQILISLKDDESKKLRPCDWETSFLMSKEVIGPLQNLTSQKMHCFT